MRLAAIEFSDLSPQRDDFARLAVNRILDTAIRVHASDIHLTQGSESTQIRMRIHGVLHEAGSVVHGSSTSIVARVKALANLTTYRNEIPQEGRLLLTDSRERRLEARVSSLPTLHGERIAIRLTPTSEESWSLDDLQLPSATANAFRQCIEQPSGVLLISGSAGSGKTTTAYAILRELLKQPVLKSMVSLEDPVEREIPGIAQSQIHSDKGYSWTEGLRALLRQDPEVMLVGEIRDAETAHVVFQAAMTGQLVITTMHAQSCADAIRRLLDFEVPPQHLAAGLRLSICQRLLPILCDCQGQAQLAEQRCEHCGGSGTRGLKLLVEQFPRIQGELKRAISTEADVSEIQSTAMALGMQPLAEQVGKLRKSGEISLGTMQDD